MADSSAGTLSGASQEAMEGTRDLSPDEKRALGVVQTALFGTAERPVHLERYELREHIGSGGAGAVWSAWDPELDRTVAVKLLAPAARRNHQESEARRRLLREARAIAKLSHPNVVTVFDVGEYETGDHERGTFVVMEYVEGADGAKWLREGRSPGEILDVFIQGARGIVAAHGAGLVHRDLKPSNLLIGKDATAKVADFGLAALMERPEDRISVDSSSFNSAQGEEPSRLTRSGTIMGTPHYMSPEQHEGGTLDPRSDQFSFGVSLFEALYGRRPYTGATLLELAEAKAKGPPPTVPLPGVPVRVRRAITRMLEPDPDRRFADMAEVLAVLSPSSTRRTLGLVGVALVLATSGGALGMKAMAGPSCIDAQALSEALWGPARREHVREAFEDTNEAFARAAFAAADDAMLRHVQEWQRLREAACTREDPRLRHAQESCLDRRYEELLRFADALGTADGDVAERAPVAAQAYGDFRDCLDESAELASFSETPAGQEAASWLVESRVAQRLGDALGAGRAARAGLDVLDQSGTSSPGLELLRSRLLLQASHAQFETGDSEESLAMAQDAWIAAEHAGDERSAVAALGLWLRLNFELGKTPEDLEARLELLKAKGPRALGAQFEAVQRSLEARLLFRQGRYAEAAPMYEALAARLGPTDLALANALGSAAACWTAAGSVDRARPLVEQAEKIILAVLGDQHPEYALQLAKRADLETVAGNYQAAAALQRRAIDLLQRVRPYDVNLAIQRTNYANSLTYMHAYEEAFENQETALPVLIEKLGPSHVAVALTLNNAAAALLELGRIEPARERLLRAEAIFESSDPPHPDYGMVLINFGVIALVEGNHAEAQHSYERAISFIERTLSPDHPRLLAAAWGLAETALRRDDEEAAIAALRRGRELSERGGPEALMARLDSVEARLSSTPPATARALAERALPILRRARSAADDIRALEGIIEER